MLAARSGASYSAKAVQKEHQSRGKDALPSPDRLLTDRGSYIAYLESQLERVSAACLTVTSFDERLEQAVSAIRCLEEKTINLARLVAVTQQFAEQQEAAQRESAAEVLRRLRGVEARLEELEEPARAAAWEAKLRAVSAQVDAKLAEVGAASEAGLAEAAGRLQAQLEEGCHTAHLALEKRMGEAAGRLTEVERKVRAVDERAAKLDVTEAAVADLAGRVGGMEDSVAHLAQSDAGMKGSLGSLQAAVAQLKTAVVALELRPPLGDATSSSADCLQWLERAREALKREVTDIQQQHVQLAAGLNSAVAAAAAAPASPQKQLAAQVLSGLQCSMQQEVGKELQALRLADQLLESVTSQFKRSPPRVNGGEGAQGSTAAPAAGGKDAAVAAAAATSSNGGGWTIAAVPAAGAAAGAAQPAAAQLAYPPAPSSQQAVAVAADGAFAQLQQLAGGEQQLAQAAAALAATTGSPTGCSSSSSGSLRNTFGQMQSMLQSVCQLLQDGEQAPPRRPNEAAYQAAASRYLSRSSTLAQSRRSGSPDGVGGAAKRAWLPGGSGKLAGSSSSGAGAAAAAGGGASTNRTLSFGGAGGGAGGGSAREALRESVLGQAALEQRRKRLQQLYAELKGQ